jgi:hypothetical protein
VGRPWLAQALPADPATKNSESFMRKSNVFLVTGRNSAGLPDDRGPVVERVVCAADETALRHYLKVSLPGFVVLGIVSLAALEDAAARVRQALAQPGAAGGLTVLVDPKFQR